MSSKNDKTFDDNAALKQIAVYRELLLQTCSQLRGPSDPQAWTDIDKIMLELVAQANNSYVDQLSLFSDLIRDTSIPIVLRARIHTLTIQQFAIFSILLSHFACVIERTRGQDAHVHLDRILQDTKRHDELVMSRIRSEES